MENLGNQNLFTSHFVMGCAISDYTNLSCITSLRQWLQFKDSDAKMSKHSVSRTQYVSFLHEIDLENFKSLLNDLIFVYRCVLPHSEKKDFIQDVFGYSIYDLGKIINGQFRQYGFFPRQSKYKFYYLYDFASKEFLDFAIPSKRSITYFQQYYKKILRIIENVDFEKIQSNQENLSKQKIIEIKKSTNQSKYDFSAAEWAAIFCYAHPFIIGTKDGFKRENLISFREKHKIPRTYNSLRGKCYEVNKRLHTNFTFSVEVLENKVKPFLEIYYPHTISSIDDDIEVIKSESNDY